MNCVGVFFPSSFFLMLNLIKDHILYLVVMSQIFFKYKSAYGTCLLKMNQPTLSFSMEESQTLWYDL